MHADGGADGDVLAGGLQHARKRIPPVHLYAVVIAAGAEQVLAVGGDGEVAGMLAGGAEAYALHEPGFYLIYGYTVFLKPMTCVQELAVGGEVDVGAAVAVAIVCLESLYWRQGSIDIRKNYQHIAQFAEQIGIFAVCAEYHVAGAVGEGIDILPGDDGFAEGLAVGAKVEAEDTVAAQVGEEEVFAIWR